MDDQTECPEPEQETPISTRPTAHIRDDSSHATGSSIFDKADMGNWRLGRRNRT
jgi:hypothetical protein